MAQMLLAEDVSSSAVDAVKNLATNVAAQGTDAVTAILPIMGGLIAVGIVVTLGIKWVRRTAK